MITLPKATTSAVAVPPALLSTTPPPDSADWNVRLVDRMTRIQRRMDQVFRDTLPGGLTSSGNVLRLGSSVNVDDQENQYVVHFNLPDRDVKDVDVKFKDGQLDLVAREKKTVVNGGVETTEMGQYEQMITLSQPVKEKEMKVERSGSTVTVTLPKASL